MSKPTYDNEPPVEAIMPLIRRRKGMIQRKIIDWIMPAIMQALVKQIHSNPILGIEIERIVRRVLREQPAQFLSRKAQQKQ